MSLATIAECEAQYLANASYEGDAAKQILALEALRGMRILRANAINSGGGGLTYEQIGAEIAVLEKSVKASTRTSYTPMRAKYL
jgi:hypothetical protein